MTPQQLAEIHQAAFAVGRSWTAEEFTALLKNPHVSLTLRSQAFALVQTVADEAELLTLAVHPAHQRKGLADALMREWMRHTAAHRAFLEVAADNAAARQLYLKHGFAQSGRRKGYYQRPDGPAVDAVLMTAALPYGHGAESPRLR